MLYQKLWFILFTRFHNLNVFEERIKLVIIFVIFDGIIFTWNIIDCFDLICHFFIEALQLSQFFYIKTIIFIRKLSSYLQNYLLYSFRHLSFLELLCIDFESILGHVLAVKTLPIQVGSVLWTRYLFGTGPKLIWIWWNFSAVHLYPHQKMCPLTYPDLVVALKVVSFGLLLLDPLVALLGVYLLA